MGPHFKLSSDEVTQLRVHYHGTSQDILRILWRRKVLIALFAVAGILCGIAANIVMPLRYKGEAILHLSFNRDEPSTATKTQRIASMEAGALVESTVRILRSRALSAAVVSRLRLEDDTDFTRPSRLMLATNWARQTAGLPVIVPSPHDIATERLSGALEVNIVPRSYIIVVAIAASDPERAAALTNAVILEYLRSKRMQQLVDLQQGIERDLAEVAAHYGPQHPRRADLTEKLQDIRARIAALRDAKPSNEGLVTDGGEFIPAQPVMMPAGPSALIFLALSLGIWLVACAALIVVLELKRSRGAGGRLPSAAAAEADGSTGAMHGTVQEVSSPPRLIRANE